METQLFRGKAINRDPNREYRTNYKNGDWVFGLLSKFDDYGAEMTNEDGVSRIDVDPETVGRVTKINEILFGEGDIIEVSASRDGEYKAHGIIRFGEFEDYNGNVFTGFYIEWQGENYKYHRKSIKWWLKERDLKIVGNIYDMPDFLEENK